ncbi:MAG TPA: hypothetical protein VML55_17760 [Planctomycetaceae bacterium]|nr:hypothetical protein [Planctomycetaceae bacterium]
MIALIQAALIEGQSQPWMYEVLALSMQIAGRPNDEIERVLFSGVDFTGADYGSMMFSAAYLVRFKRTAPALHLYRQAARVEPTRPEPYALGLKLARESKDHVAIQWAATGILRSERTGEQARLSREAEDAALDAIQELRRLGREEQAVGFEQALADARQRDLVIRLAWSGHGDLDLVVEEPPGTVCSFENPYSRGGGVLVHDGYGPDPKNCFEEYVAALAMPGHYRVRIRHVIGNVVGKRAQLTVTRYRGTAEESTQTFSVPLAGRETVVRLALAAGRRHELADVPDAVSRAARPAERRRTLLQMLGAPDGMTRRLRRDFDASRNVREPGFRPVVTVLQEGATLQALAVVSGDRRFVRITPIPFFSTITDVFTFSFQGGGDPGGGGVPGGGLGGGFGGNPPGG